MSGGSSSSNGNAAAADGPAERLQVQGAAAGNSGDGSTNKRRSTGDYSAGAPIGSTSRGNSGNGGNISWQAAAAAAVPRDTAGPMGPELQEAVDQVRPGGLSDTRTLDSCYPSALVDIVNCWWLGGIC
jgi:hypothetical protein